MPRGYNLATIDYRLGFNVTSGGSALRAVYRGSRWWAALRFLENCDQYAIDTNHIVLMDQAQVPLSVFIMPIWTKMNDLLKLMEFHW